MSTTTTNYELIKPELTDVADITAMNENWDKIDEELHTKDVEIGDLSKLSTTTKDNLVNAVNELFGTTPIERGGTGATTAEAARTNLNVQKDLGFTPVQQGTGKEQTTNSVKIGWSGSTTKGLKVTVDESDLGSIITTGSVDSVVLPVAKGGTGKTNLGDVIVGGADWAEWANHFAMNDCSNTDLNTLKTPGFYFGYTGMTNAAVNSISVIEVIPYSNDWLLQRQTRLEDGKMFYRCYRLGTTWSQWYSIYTTQHKPTPADIGAVSRSEWEANLLANASVEPKGV